MQCMWRNKRTIWVAHYQGEVQVGDTAETYSSYSTPIQMRVNVSSAATTSGLETNGSRIIDFFGNFNNYTRTIQTSGDCEFQELDRIWVDVTPNSNADNYNYVVTRVADGLWENMIAIKEVPHTDESYS